MSRRKLTFANAGGSAKAGSVVNNGGVAYVAVRDTDTSPPGEHWTPAVIETEAFAALNGEDGKDGIDGESIKGNQGERGEAGKSFNWLGDWQQRRKYLPLDCVGHEGSSWVAVRQSQAKEPGEASTYWDLMAARGERGLRGERGEQGGAGQRGRSVLVETDAFGTQTAKAFFDSAAVRGSVVRVSGDNHVDLALAHGSDAAALAVGLAVAATGENAFGNYVTGGPFTNESWNLTPGATYYLSPTNPGEITDVFPNTLGDYVVILGIALTPKTLNLKIEWTVVIGS